ncbi:MAG: prepilin-type N-terminal cleavage/methylation domain-containing protein [Thioploca sp.]|nr:prepilin-type N-terminal cleavage/methylation domain-containing protein [Thioploca sp.]
MNQRGFTLLEAIVALALFASTGIALLSWINTNLMSLQRIQQAQQRQQAIQNALVFMETVNPLEKPQGKETIGIYQIDWNATALELPKDGVTSLGGISLFQIGLYETEVKVKVKQDLLAQFTLRQAGYKQVRQFKDEFQ